MEEEPEIFGWPFSQIAELLVGGLWHAVDPGTLREDVESNEEVWLFFKRDGYEYACCCNDVQMVRRRTSKVW